MGQSLGMVCKTCKIQWYLGYGGAAFHDALLSQFPHNDHVDHDIQQLGDYDGTDKAGNLVFKHPWDEDILIVPADEYRTYRYIDWTKGER